MSKIKTLSYTNELFEDVMANMTEYHQIGWTVCGAQDQAVIEVSAALAVKYPKLKGLTVVRVGEHFVNANQSNTFLEFSTRGITPEEYARYEEIVDEL